LCFGAFPRAREENSEQGFKMAKKKYATISQEKRYTKDEVNGIWNENERAYTPENVDKNRLHKNITLKPNPYKNYDDFVERKKRQIEEANKSRKKKARMVAKKYNEETNRLEYESMMMDFSFSHSPGIMSESDSIEYLKLAHQFIVDWFPDNEVFSSVIHLDEKTPHSHIWVSFFDEKDNRFKQRKLRSQRKTDITVIRNAFQAYLKDTKFNYLKKQDGKVVGKNGYDGSKANTKLGKARTIIDKKNQKIATLKEVTAEAREKELTMEEQKSEMETLGKRLLEQINDIKKVNAEQEAELNELKSNLATAEVAQVEKDAQIANLEVLKSENQAKEPDLAKSLEVIAENCGLPVNKVFQILDKEISRLAKPGQIDISEKFIDYEKIKIAHLEDEKPEIEECKPLTEQEQSKIWDQVDLISERLSALLIGREVSQAWEMIREVSQEQEVATKAEKKGKMNIRRDT